MYKMMMMYSCLMMMMAFVCLFWTMIIFYLDIDLFMEWVLCSVNSFMLEIFVLIDWVSLVFVSFVLLISSMVVLYSIGYMHNDKNLDRFVSLVILFVISMLMTILSPSLFSILFGWDLLGLVSYCLVVHYQNNTAYNSGMVTILSNRIGDVGLLLAIGLGLGLGSWNFSVLKNDFILMMFILIAAMTKSAQMPFSSWLPLAMAAPTPISSLVHSSTLVTAGVYLIIRFNKFVMDSGVNFILMAVSVGTMVMSSLMASFEFDLKKIIALSTLSQLGFMMMILSTGLTFLGVFHLLMHAVFKSLLFMCSGCLIHMFKGNQDIRFYGNLSSSFPFLMMSFFVSILSLMGFPFLAGFYSKDIIMEMMYSVEINLFLVGFIIISISLTVMYSLRLCFYLFYGDNKFSALIVGGESNLMSYSMVVLVFVSIFGGSLLNWLFYFDLGGVFLKGSLKSIVMFFFFLGSILVTGFLSSQINYSKNWGMFVISMWYLNFFYSWFNKYCNNLGGNLFLIDSSWLEVLEGSFFLKIKFILSKVYYSEFKMYDVIFSKILIFLIVINFLSVILSG